MLTNHLIEPNADSSNGSNLLAARRRGASIAPNRLSPNLNSTPAPESPTPPHSKNRAEAAMLAIQATARRAAAVASAGARGGAKASSSRGTCSLDVARVE